MAEDNRIQSKTSNVYLIKWQVSVFTTESTKIQETTLPQSQYYQHNPRSVTEQLYPS